MVNIIFFFFNSSQRPYSIFAPLKKLNKKQLRLEAKPWITPGIVNSIKKREKLLRQYIKTTEPNLKNELYNEYKKFRNKLVAIIRKRKKHHFQTYFTENAKNINFAGSLNSDEILTQIFFIECIFIAVHEYM